MPSTDNQSELRDKLAAIEHERWADWQKLVHKKSRRITDFGGAGGLMMHQEDVDRWEKQIATPYHKLSDTEKASDMEQVDRYWPLIIEYIQAHDTKLYEQVMGAIGEDKSVKQLLPNVEFKPDEYCAGIVAAKDASNRNLKELRTAINKIFNK